MKRFALAIFILVAGTAPAFGEQTFTADGVAEVIGEDRAAARDRAIDDALRKAVEQAVATLVTPESMDHNFGTLQDRVYTQSQGYIQNYRILSEKPEPGVHQVTVQAAVAMTELQKHLQALRVLPRQIVKPRIAVLVAEQNIDRQAYDFRWREGMEEASPLTAENAILEKLREKGFETVNCPLQGDSLNISPALRIPELDDAAAAAIAKQAGAEVVIVGKVLAKPGGTIGNTLMKSAQAHITLRAIQADDVRVLSTGFGNAAAVHTEELAAGSEAIRKAGARVAEKLTEDILKNFRRSVESSTTVRLTVFGLSGAEDLRKFKESVLGQVRGIQGVHEREFSESTVKIDLEMKGNAQSFSQEVKGREFPPFTLKVLRSTLDTLDLEVLPR